MPSSSWQDRARRFVAYCEDELHRNAEVLAYLKRRGLSSDTIRSAHLGYSPRAYRDAPSRWGLEGKPVWLPAGWVIPCTIGDQLAYVKVRQASGEPKYVIIRGGRKQGMRFGLDDLAGHTDGVLVEGEFNALTLRQAICGTAGVASLGDASNRPGAVALPLLARVRRLWTLHDLDAAGMNGQTVLANFSARVRSLDWPFGAMDVNDAYVAGHDLPGWMLVQIGPVAPSSRVAWAEHHLKRLENEPDIENGSSSTFHVWQALLDVYTKAWRENAYLPPTDQV